MTGREAVEYFTNCLHTGKIQFLHFIEVANRRYDPYNLISVPENKVSEDHQVAIKDQNMIGN